MSTTHSQMRNPQSALLFVNFMDTLSVYKELTRGLVLDIGKQMLGELFGKFEMMINKHKQLTRNMVFEIAKQVIVNAEQEQDDLLIQMALNQHCCLSHDMAFQVVKQLLDESLFDKFQMAINEHQRASQDRMLFEVAKRVLQEKINETPSPPTLVQSPTSAWIWFTILIQTLIILFLLYVICFHVDISTYLRIVTQFRQAMLL